MIRLRNVGPVLALTGAGIAAAAIIAGFVIVGGPGNARDERLDQLTLQRVNTVIAVVQCAFNASGLAPATFQSALDTRPAPNDVYSGAQSCGDGQLLNHIRIEGAETPKPGEVTYSASGPTLIKVCANYRAANDTRIPNARGQWDPPYPTTDAHPAGVHCSDIDLVTTLPPSATQSPVP